MKSLVAAALGIPMSSIKDFSILNPEIAPPYVEDKYCRLDISMQVNSQRVTIEVQVQNEGDFRARSLLYWSRAFSSSLKKGQSYSELPEVISLNILGFKLFECSEHESRFAVMEESRHTRLSDHLQMIFYELPKLPKRLTPDDPLGLWLAFFSADSPAQRERISELGGAIMKQANKTFNNVIASEKFQALERMRLDASHRKASLIKQIKAQKDEEIARKEMVMAREMARKLAQKDEEMARKEMEMAREMAWKLAQKDEEIAKLRGLKKN